MTPREEYEDLLSAMSKETKEDLKDIPLNELPLDTFQLNSILQTIQKQVLERHGATVRKVVKLNTLMRLNDGKAEAPKPVPIQLTPELTKEVTLSEIGKILSSSIKRDDAGKLITFSCMLLSQTESDQVNIGFQSESSAGKSYIPIEIAGYFPEHDVIIIASASPTAFFHDRGVWDEQRKVLIVNLEGKILIFLDQPHFQLLEKLRPVLSHDMKELVYKITDKNQKQGLRTKNVVVRGYPSVIFCTTKMNPDEQEKTRLILLSPSVDQEKLRESLRLISLRQANREEYNKTIQQDLSRIWLMDRIKAIRQIGIKEVVVPNHEVVLYQRFLKEHPHLIGRHQRDFPRIISFIKAHSLLNCFNRKQRGMIIEASEHDIAAGFNLYKQIEESNELGLSPYVHKVYVRVIEPLLDPQTGVSKKEILSSYYSVNHKTLSPKLLDDILSQLEAAGMVEERPDILDKRTKLIYPTVSGNIATSDLFKYLETT